MNALITKSRKVLQSYRDIDDLEIFDLRSVVLYTTDLIRTSYPERKINMEVEFFDPPPLVRADILVRDIFQNLFDNSVKNSNGDVEISVEGKVDGDGWYSVIIRDNGPGLPDGKGDELFRLFRGTNRTSGSGMGLYLVKRLMERYGGRVNAKERGEADGYGGAEFKLDFPRIASDRSIMYDTINNDISDPVRYILFRKYSKDGKNLMDFGGDTHDLDDLQRAGKIDLIERFGWNVSRAIHEAIRYIKEDGVYRYDFLSARTTGPIDPRFYGD
jgi:hypothetical protein